MDNRFLGAFLSLTNHKVAGYTLKPFCLRHRITLEAINSPLLPGSYPKSFKPTDIILAARICSIADPFKAVTGFKFMDSFRAVIYANNEKALNAELELWKNYIKDTASHPIVNGKKTKEQKNRGLDWKLSVITTLIGMGFSEEQAWTMPEGRAMFYFFAHAIKSGADLDITTTEQEDKLPMAKAMVQQAITKANQALKEQAKNPRKKG